MTVCSMQLFQPYIDFLPSRYVLLVHDELKVKISEYAPPQLLNDPSIKEWLNENSPFGNNPSKWKLHLLASVIYDFDVILKNVGKMLHSLLTRTPRLLYNLKSTWKGHERLRN